MYSLVAYLWGRGLTPLWSTSLISSKYIFTPTSRFSFTQIIAFLIEPLPPKKFGRCVISVRTSFKEIRPSNRAPRRTTFWRYHYFRSKCSSQHPQKFFHQSNVVHVTSQNCAARVVAMYSLPSISFTIKSGITVEILIATHFVNHKIRRFLDNSLQFYTQFNILFYYEFYFINMVAIQLR